MQPWTYETEAERHRAGDYELYTRIAQTYAAPRKKQGGWLTEQGWDALLILGFAGGFVAYLGWQIWQGLGPVLRAHGLI